MKLRRLWCSLVGHRWQNRGLFMFYLDLWVCACCKDARGVPPGLEPRP